MKYLLDANTFIEAKNRYYGMVICPAYWQWILKSNDENEVCSIDSVKSELANYGDELSDWVKDNHHIFHPESDEETQLAFQNVVTHVMSMTDMKNGTHEEFLRGADPWLIARAMVTGATIVTHEQFKPGIKKKILIPNVCKDLGVNYMDTFELLHNLDAEFVLPAPLPA
jgi:hypothetical protein